jgi:hypothetical protein
MKKEKKEKKEKIYTSAEEIMADVAKGIIKPGQGVPVDDVSKIIFPPAETWTLICKTYIETANGSQELVNLMQNDQTMEVRAFLVK